MEIFGWNVRGLNDPAKHREVSSVFWKNKVDVFGILETRVKAHKADKLMNKCFRESSYFCNYTSHSNGHIMLVWRHSVKLEVVFSSAQCAHCKVSSWDGKIEFFCTFVHAFNSVEGRRQLWADLSALGTQGLPWVLLGDFNVVASPTERLSSAPSRTSSIGEFVDCLRSLDLSDVVAYGAYFTWWNKQDNGEVVWCKLDRILCNPAWLSAHVLYNAHFAEPGVSDHARGELVIEHHERNGCSLFRFLNAWAEHPCFMHIVENNWQIKVQGCAMFQNVTKLKRMKREFHQLHREYSAGLSDKINRVSTALFEC